MATKQQEILQVEKDAKELVNNLKVLHEKVGSYQSAKEELDKTNSNLLSFIEKTESLSEKSHKIIEIINKIGSGKIFEKLELLENNSKRNFIIITVGLGAIIALQVLFFLLK